MLLDPRGAGKTVMIQQTIQSLLDVGTEAARILYVSQDRPLFTGHFLENFLSRFWDLQDHEKGVGLYVFFDEIQYHPDWPEHLESLVAAYPAIHLVASASAAPFPEQTSSESGAGRFTGFNLPPLTFLEFLQFQHLEAEYFGHKVGIVLIKDQDSLNQQFVRYPNYGGFPEAVMEERLEGDSGRNAANHIAGKVLFSDLPNLYGIADIQELNRLFAVLAYNSGREVSIHGLSQSSALSKNSIKKYFAYLESAFLIRRLPRLDQNAKRFERQTRFKIYLINPSMRAALFGAVEASGPEMDHLVEAALAGQYAQSPKFRNLYYAKWNTGP